MPKGCSVGWLGANHQRPAPRVGAMATCESNVEASETQSTQCSIRRSHSPTEAAQLSAGESLMEANEDVSKLEAAVAALGGEKSAHAKPLIDALKMARAQSKVPLVRERMQSCRKFIERAKERVMGAEELITKVAKVQAVFLLEVEEAEERSKQLESEAAAPAFAASDRCINFGARFAAGDAENDAGSAVQRMALPNSKQSRPYAHFGSSRYRNMVQQSELRVEECVGVWGHRDYCQGWHSGGSEHRSTHFIRDGGANGKHNEVNTDGCVDRFSGREETMLASRFKPCIS